MKSFGGRSTIFDFNPFEESTTQMHQLGTKGETGDGRIFRYGKAGEEIPLGYLAVMPDQDTAELTISVTTAAAIGDKKVIFTHAATTATANEYAEGYLSVSFGTGIGQTLKIASHAALTSGGTGEYVNLEDPIQVALDTTSRIDLTPNVYSGVLTVTTDAAISVPCGVPLRTVTSGSYAWFQTRGVVAVAADATIAAGYEVQGDTDDAAGGKVTVTGTDAQVWKIGHALQAAADTYSHPIYLTID